MKHKTTLKKKKEFRFHDIEAITKNGEKKRIRHPTYVFYENGDIYVYVSLTHSKKIKNVLLIKLRKNPNPKDERDSYWVVEIKEDKKGAFGKKQ